MSTCQFERVELLPGWFVGSAQEIGLGELGELLTVSQRGRARSRFATGWRPLAGVRVFVGEPAEEVWLLMERRGVVAVLLPDGAECERGVG